jgi:hypothetical protein
MQVLKQRKESLYSYCYYNRDKLSTIPMPEHNPFFSTRKS